MKGRNGETHGDGPRPRVRKCLLLRLAYEATPETARICGAPPMIGQVVPPTAVENVSGTL